jgi:hypothetical protein
MTEQPNYLVLYSDYKGLRAPEREFIELAEGEENLKEYIVSCFNTILNEDYENPDQEDFDEITDNIMILQVDYGKEKFVKKIIKEHLSAKKTKDYKEYLRLKKEFEK